MFLHKKTNVEALIFKSYGFVTNSIYLFFLNISLEQVMTHWMLKKSLVIYDAEYFSNKFYEHFN